MEELENNQNTNLNETSDNKIYVSVMGAIIVIICFFLPWVEMDCMGKKTISGADIGGPLWVVPIGAAIFIFVFYSFYKRNEISKIVSVALINFVIATIIIAYKYFSFTESLKKELGSTPESLGMTLKYGAVLTIIGEVIILVGCAFIKEKANTRERIVSHNSNETISQLEKLGKLKEQNLITEEEFLNQKSILLNSQKVDFVQKLSSVDYISYLDRAGIWFNKNKKSIFAIGSGIMLLLLIYIFFIKNNPDKDGKNSAMNYCDCSDQYNKDLNKAKEDFIKSFDSYNLKNRKEARDRLNEILVPINNVFAECNKKAKTKYEYLRARYNKDNSSLKKFDNSYSEYKSNYKLTEPTDLAINSKVNIKINTIKEKEPDSEKIKKDLLGKKMSGWSFDYLSEFKKFEILSTINNNDKLEYRIKLELLDEKKNTYHKAEIIVKYLMSDDGWILNSISQNYFTNE